MQDSKKMFFTTNFNEKMIVFPNCKINLGLQVTEKRTDGYHNLASVFYPISWCDVLEIQLLPEQNANSLWQSSGLSINGSYQDNILYKTYCLLQTQFNLPPLRTHLHKQLPMGAGLGGGSADAVFFMQALLKQCQISTTHEQQLLWAAQLGSDCPFFVHNTPQYVTGRGEVLKPCQIDLSAYAIALIYPAIHSHTKDAFSGLQPQAPTYNLQEIIEQTHPKNWKKILQNDFESTIFKKYPEIEQLKTYLYAQGAYYASLSGSGSTVYGIFETTKELKLPKNYLVFWQKP